MLYISSRHSWRKFGITDTDDGVESFVDLDELTNYVCEMGLVIEGVVTRLLKNGKLKIESINVYQNTSYSSAKQVKTAMLNGVSIIVDAGRITKISFQRHITSKVVIRLSDYGSSIASYVFRGERGDCGPGVVFLLDDNIVFSAKSFKGITYVGCKLDIHEVTNSKAVSTLYRSFVFGGQDSSWFGHWDERVLDNPERLDFWKAFSFICESSDFNRNKFTKVAEICKRSDISSALYKYFAKDFKALTACKIDTTRVYWSDVIEWASKDWHRYIMSKRTYKDVFDCAIPLFPLLLEYFNITDRVLVQLKNFMKYCTLSKDMQDMCIAFVSNTGGQVYQYCLEHHG